MLAMIDPYSVPNNATDNPPPIALMSPPMFWNITTCPMIVAIKPYAGP